MPALRRFLVVDDDPVFSRILSRALLRRGYEVACAASPTEALESALQAVPGWVVLDLNLAGKSGLALLPHLLALNPLTHVLVLTGYASIETAVDAIKLGARQYLAKPANADEVLRALGIIERDSAETSGAPGDKQLARTLEQLEWDHIRRQLAAHGGNVSATARSLKMNLRTLQRKIAAYQGTSKEIPLGRMRTKRRRPVSASRQTDAEEV
jgi:two-component system response regulator RegA